MQSLARGIASVLFRKEQEIALTAWLFNDTHMIPNRYQCQRDMETILSHKDAHGTFIILDLDDFKYINDAYGHREGDNLLKVISRFLYSLPYGQNVYHFGGDEFCMLMNGDAEANIDKLLQITVERFHKPWSTPTLTHYCTASIGLTHYQKDGQTVDDIFRSADIAMYSAKNNDKNGVARFSKVSNNEVFNRVLLENLLRSTVANGYKGFEIHYQPWLMLV